MAPILSRLSSGGGGGLGGFGFGKKGGGSESTGPFSATGGSVVDGITSGNYKFYVFTANTPAPQSSLIVTGRPAPAPSITIMAIGGGGGGGSGHAGGGGAGALVLLPAGSSALPTGTYPVSIGAGGEGANGPVTSNVGTSGGATTFGTTPSNFYIQAPGGGRGGGWSPGGDPSIYGGQPGGSGGGTTFGDPLPPNATYTGGTTDTIPAANRFNGNATPYGNIGGQSNNGTPGSRGGTGGGGAGTPGQGTENSGSNPNPTSIPATHPTYPSGVRNFGGTTPSSPVDMTSAPLGTTIWPSESTTVNAGAFGGHGLKVPAFPAPVISPAIPAPNQSAFQTEVTSNGYYAAGGGGGSHTASMSTPNGGGLGGIGGGGQGGRHNNPATNGISAIYGTGSGGGGGGQQPNNGGAGAAGIVIVRIDTTLV